VKRILLTGMSGTGKTTVISELAASGYRAVDVDCDEFSQWVEVVGDADPFGSPVENGQGLGVAREPHSRPLVH
jgi:dephospho-CoA kinase